MEDEAKRLAALRNQIARYKALARGICDADTERKILLLTDDLESQARELSDAMR